MLFNVWNPARVSAGEVSFDVTRANVARVRSGDAEWIAACLEAIGVAAAARDWSVEAARCHFYSDYADETEWRDRWPETWVVRVRLDGAAPADFGAPASVPRIVDRYDRTWRHGDVDAAHDRNALVVLVLRDRTTEATRVRDRLLASLPPSVGPAQTSVDRPGGEWMRVRISVTGQLFPEQADALERFLLACRAAGCVVNRSDVG